MRLTTVLAATLVPAAAEAANDLLTEARQHPHTTRLAARRQPEGVCWAVRGEWQWIGRFCNACDSSGNLWLDLCWLVIESSASSSVPADWSNWATVSSGGWPMACIDARLRQPRGINAESLPRHPGWSIANHFSCPFEYKCKQALDEDMHAHAFCVSERRRPGSWDFDWRHVNSHGVTADVPAEMDTIVGHYWMPGQHPSQRPDPPVPRLQGSGHDLIASTSGGRSGW